MPQLSKTPNHLAIIMDGNGRWATNRKRPRIFGHIRGSSKVRPIVTECGRLGIRYLTLFCFSSENWGRPDEEVSTLMRILKKYLHRELKTLMKNNVRLMAIGDKDQLPKDVRSILDDTIKATSQNSGLTLIFALSYGSRQEILQAVKQVGSDLVENKISLSDIDEELFSSRLFTKDIPDPDLVIRTSGEYRISNFLLWQSAYTEFFVTEKLWPDFSIPELHSALANYQKRNRRFGLTDKQITSSPQPETNEAPL